MKYLPKIAFLLCCLLAVAFSFKALREPDLWWQIKTGEWILKHFKVPAEDVFSFTHQGVSWINIKWGFEVVAAIITKAFGAECVFVLQAVVSILLLYFLWKLAFAFSENISDKKRGNSLLAATVLFPVLLAGIEYRIIGRPEMTSHLMTVVFLYVLLRHRFQPGNFIYWIVPLQCLWANFHEAFGIGIVLTGIFFAASIVEWKILKLQSTNLKAVKTLGIAFLLSIGIVFLNPYGYKMLLQPLEIFGQVLENKFTTELFSITSHEYWQKEAWFAIVWLIVSVVSLVVIFLQSKRDIKVFLGNIPLAYLLVVIAFIYLASTAFRNIIFLDLVLFPLPFLLLQNLLSRKQKVGNIAAIVSIAAVVVLYAAVVTNKYYEMSKSRDRFGMEVRPDFNAVGAANYVVEHNLSGKCFSDYLISSYLLWSIPNFKTFIDLRDLDVFPSSFFNTFTEAVAMPSKFAELDAAYNFSYAVLYRPQFGSLHRFLSEGNGYHLVFADAVAAVYVKDTIKQNTFDATTFKPVPPSKTSATAYFLNKLLNPFHHSGSVLKADNHAAAAVYFIAIGKVDFAMYHAQQILNTDEAFKGNELLGQIYYNKFAAATSDSSEIYLGVSGSYFSKALQQNDNYYPALMGLGAVCFQQKFLAQAKAMFKRATEVEPENTNAWLSLAACHKSTLQQAESLDEAIHCFLQADKLNKNNPLIQFELGILYFQKNDCKKAVERLQKVRGFEGLNIQEKQLLENCMRQCGA